MNEDGEFELVLGNKQLFSVFFVVAVLFGVCFLMGYTVGKNIGFGYVRNASGVDEAMLKSGRYELEVAAERMACTLHLAPLYDPRGDRVKA